MPQLYDPELPPRSGIERMAELNPRAALAFGGSMWGAGTLVLALHITGVLRSQLWFSVTDTWLIGLGCYGTPITLIHGLGRRARPQMCIGAAVFLTGIAGVVTVLTAVGEMRPEPLNLTFALVLLLALAIHALNAADLRYREQRAYTLGFEEGRLQGVLDSLGVMEQRAATCAAAEEMTVEEMEARHAELGRTIARRRAGMAGYGHLQAMPPLKAGGEPSPSRTRAR